MKAILFNTPMTTQVKNDLKTATRRCILYRGYDGKKHVIPPDAKYLGITCYRHTWETSDSLFSLDAPFQRGDILYVRETWRCLEASYPPGRCIIEYKAGGNKEFQAVFALPTQKGEWKPSIHMPKSVARLFIRVTDVRVERLKDISASSAMDEGFTDWNDFVAMWDSTVPTAMLSERGWDANPWVWVIEFERIRKDV